MDAELRAMAEKAGISRLGKSPAWPVWAATESELAEFAALVAEWCAATAAQMPEVIQSAPSLGPEAVMRWRPSCDDAALAIQQLATGWRSGDGAKETP